jgi:hypothetical protein
MGKKAAPRPKERNGHKPRLHFFIDGPCRANQPVHLSVNSFGSIGKPERVRLSITVFGRDEKGKLIKPLEREIHVFGNEEGKRTLKDFGTTYPLNGFRTPGFYTLHVRAWHEKSRPEDHASHPLKHVCCHTVHFRVQA